MRERLRGRGVWVMERRSYLPLGEVEARQGLDQAKEEAV